MVIKVDFQGHDPRQQFGRDAELVGGAGDQWDPAVYFGEYVFVAEVVLVDGSKGATSKQSVPSVGVPDLRDHTAVFDGRGQRSTAFCGDGGLQLLGGADVDGGQEKTRREKQEYRAE